MNLISQLKSKLTDYRWLALLDMISWAEGADYNTFFGGSTFSDYSRHPNKVISASRYKSSAAGRYQIMDFNWRELVAFVGFKDFTPLSQDLAAIYLIWRKRKVSPSLVENPSSQNLLKILKLIGNEWASLGFNKYGQPVKGVNALTRKYQEFLAARAKGEGVNTLETPLGNFAPLGDRDLLGEYNQSPNIDQTSIFSALLTGENDCEPPQFYHQQFLAYPGCLSKVTGAKVSNVFQLGASAPGMNFGQGNAPSFSNPDAVSSLALTGDLLYPLDKRYGLTDTFLSAKRKRKTGRDHRGVDVGTPIGTPIYASIDGFISLVANQPKGAGLHLNLRSSDRKYWFKYFHCDQILVKQGEKVKKGQLMAYTGNTGGSTGPHLHFELSVNGRLVDPAKFFNF